MQHRWFGAMLWLSACSGGVGFEAADGGGFVSTDADDADAGLGADADASASGCAVMDLTCTGDACCADPTSRCVPGAGGANVCVAPGELGAGEPCGDDGLDDCASGLLCATSAANATRSVCRVLCPSGDADCDGACEDGVFIAGELIRLCDTP